MKLLYPAKAFLVSFCLVAALSASAQVPTTLGPGICTGVVADFNTNDNGFNSPSVYGSIFDSSFYYHAGRGYWTDYYPPQRIAAPGAPRVLNIISPPFQNPNPNGTFNVGFYYIVGNPAVDRYQVRIISVTETPNGTVTDVEATSGVQFFPGIGNGGSAYVDGTTTSVPDPTPFLTGTQGTVCIRLVDPDIVNGPNTTFRVEVSYLLSTPTFAVFDDLSIGPFNAPLPVNFIGLVATRNTTTNTVNLRWDVGEEVNVNEYQVERSTNGANFDVVGAVNAKGKSLYSFQDNNVTAGTTYYYRVKSRDYDEKTKYSGIIRLAGDNSFSNSLIVYPNPSRDDITVWHRKLNGKGKMIIASLDGKIIRTIVPTPGASHTPVNLNGVTPGMYVIRLDDESGYSETIKLVKN